MPGAGQLKEGNKNESRPLRQPQASVPAHPRPPALSSRRVAMGSRARIGGLDVMIYEGCIKAVPWLIRTPRNTGSLYVGEEYAQR